MIPTKEPSLWAKLDMTKRLVDAGHLTSEQGVEIVKRVVGARGILEPVNFIALLDEYGIEVVAKETADGT